MSSLSALLPDDVAADHEFFSSYVTEGQKLILYYQLLSGNLSSAWPTTMPKLRDAIGHGQLVLPTTAMVLSQASFIGFAYSHAYTAGDISPSKFHISAVLDHDQRSTICAVIGLLGLLCLVWVEASRCLPSRALRCCLAAATGFGIISVCIVRESYYVNLHRLSAMLAFGGAVVHYLTPLSPWSLFSSPKYASFLSAPTY